MIARETLDDDVVLLRFERGKVNALDTELLAELRDQLDGLRKEGAPCLLLTGSGSSFSAGVDLYRVVDGGAEYVQHFLPLIGIVVRRLLGYPRPVVAALNGHAIAGGFVLAGATDRRLMAEGSGKVGVTELPVGVPFPWFALEVLRTLAGERLCRQMVYSGGLLGAGAAQSAGLVDELVPAERLLERALEVTRQMGRIPKDSFRLVKRQLWEPVLRRAEREEEEHDQEVQRVWEAPATHRAIRLFLQKTLEAKKG
jgi:enoyl-CoA hydratase/carnithine racemase